MIFLAQQRFRLLNLRLNGLAGSAAGAGFGVYGMLVVEDVVDGEAEGAVNALICL